MRRQSYVVEHSGGTISGERSYCEGKVDEEDTGLPSKIRDRRPKKDGVLSGRAWTKKRDS